MFFLQCLYRSHREVTNQIYLGTKILFSSLFSVQLSCHLRRDRGTGSFHFSSIRWGVRSTRDPCHLLKRTTLTIWVLRRKPSFNDGTPNRSPKSTSSTYNARWRPIAYLTSSSWRLAVRRSRQSSKDMPPSTPWKSARPSPRPVNVTCGKCSCHVTPSSWNGRRYVQDWTLTRFKFLMISIAQSVLTGKKSPKHTQFK